MMTMIQMMMMMK